MHTRRVESIILYDAVAIGGYVSLKAVVSCAVLFGVACGFVPGAGSITALAAHSIPIQGVLLMASAQNPTLPETAAENKMAIEHFGGVPVAGHIGWIDDFDNVPAQVEAALQNLLKGSATVL